jgi:hypothetical protein
LSRKAVSRQPSAVSFKNNQPPAVSIQLKLTAFADGRRLMADG